MSGYIGARVPGVISASSRAEVKNKFVITSTQSVFTGLVYTTDLVEVFHNGIRLVDGTDFTATDGSTITLTDAAVSGDEVVVIATSTFIPTGVNKAFVDSLNVNADTLDGQQGSHYVDFNNATNKPTTVAGYGITDAHSGDFATLSNKPTTLSGYGITDAATSTQGALADSALQSYTVTEGDVTGHQAALSITESQISDLGTYETADATILKDADIGVNVQAYDANIVSDATYVKTDENFTTADHSKLDGIEANATADQTKADIDALNIDADTLDGQQGSYYTGYADTAVANLVASAPSTLDTLNELAAALGDDANFSTTMTNALAGKVDDSQVLTNVPSGAVFTDTVYSHPTGNGNNHIPSGGSAEQILAYSSAGTAQWVDPSGGAVDDLYYENASTISSNKTLSSSRNTMTIGAVTINSSATVTVPDGAFWSIV